MPAGDQCDPLKAVRHALKTPLTTIYGRAQLLARVVRRSPSLTEAERASMLDGLATIDAAVHELVRQIDAIEVAQDHPEKSDEGAR